MITSPILLQKVLYSEKWTRPTLARKILINAFGDGILTAEGDVHRRQRKMLTPAFGVSNIRNLSWVFGLKAGELCDVLDGLLDAQGDDGVEVLAPLSRATLDVIGLAGAIP